jgi:hypothetical protein
MTFSFRPSTASDRPFIISGISASLRMTRDIPLISMLDYANIMHAQIAKLLDRTGVQCIVAEGSVLAGFIVFERGAQVVDELGLCAADYVFYVYVAQPFRKLGVARGLFAAAGIDPASRFHYACRTLSSYEARGQVPRARYSPFYARFTPEENDQHARDHAREATRRKRYR